MSTIDLDDKTSDDIWEPWKDTIRNLYLVENLSLDKVRRHMKETPISCNVSGFLAVCFCFLMKTESKKEGTI